MIGMLVLARFVFNNKHLWQSAGVIGQVKPTTPSAYVIDAVRTGAPLLLLMVRS